MATRNRTILLLLIFSLALVSETGPTYSATAVRSSTNNLKRIRFDVVTFEERDGRRDLISETTVEGPPGTDFQIKLDDARFQMDARFLTDLVTTHELRARANLQTRRLYGHSERDLPLYEEDAQTQDLQVSFEEKLVLLPFGRTDSSDQLKIEIIPSVSEQDAYLASGKLRPLAINILKQSPGGTITVEASKVPHRFAVEAVLREDGREVARGETNDALIEGPHEIALRPIDQASPDIINDPVALKLDINRYIRSRPTDEVAVEFDLHRWGTQQSERQQPVGWAGAGISELGSPLVYDVSDYYLKSSGKRYELSIRVKLAPGEDAN